MERSAEIVFLARQNAENEHQQTHKERVTYNSGNEFNVTELILEI
jgi:hypothetical protein